MKPAEQRYLEAFEALTCAFQELTGNTDPFNYSRAKELHVCLVLDLNWNSANDGADAFDSSGRPVEIKTTTAKRINGTYNGLSVYDTFSEFVDYLHSKFPENTRHIFARYEGSKLVELYELSNSVIIDILLKKIRKNFDNEGILNEASKNKKDPRLGANVCMTEIKKDGKACELHRQ